MTYLGETERFQATITDYDGTAQSPTSQEVTLYDPSGTQVDQDTSPTSDGGGVYYVDLRIPADGAEGNYKIVWKTTLTIAEDTWYGVGVYEFNVESPT